VDGDVDRWAYGRGRGRRLALVSLAAFCALTAVASVALAAGTARSGGFPRRGTQTQVLGSHYWETGFSALGARADGGLVAGRDYRVESFLPNGAPDSAAPPRQLPEFSQWFPLASGKSLVQKASKLTRLNPDGSVDTSFGTEGSVDWVDYASAATELPSGKILVAGAGAGGTHVTFYFVNYELFGADGTVAGGWSGSEGLGLSLPGDGGGVSEIAPGPDGGSLIVGGHFLLELRADGTPNPAFGANGLVIHQSLSLVGARVLSDGSVDAVGTGPGHDGRDLLYIHLTAAGQPDPAFGSEGARLFDLGGEEDAHVATWGADGSVVVGGSSLPHGACFEVADCEEVPILAAFDPAGNLEPAFGTGGVVRLEALGGRSDELTGNGVEHLTRRPDGSLVAAGTAPPEETVAFLSALSPQGALLPGFGEGGIVRERRATPAEQTIAGIVPAGQGGMLALGNSTLGVEGAPLLIRYSSDGSLDGSFGDGAGYVTLGDGYTTGFADDGSGHLLTALSDYPRSRLVEVRSGDGAPEESFGSNGAVTLPKDIFTEAVAFASDGGAIVMGSRDVGGPAEPGVVLRYDRDGKPDRRFGKAGRVDLFAPGRREMRARALSTLPGGRTLVAGFSHHSFALAQLLGDGRPDPRFGSHGWMLTAVGGQQLASGGGRTRAVALSRDGSHIYLAAVTRDGKRFRLSLLRFHSEGRLDRGFGRDGRRTVSIPQAAEPNAIVPTRRGALVVLNAGPRPLVTFANDGRVRQRSVGRGREVTNVRAAVAGGRLALGWNARIPAYGNAYYLGEQSLGAR
jgi:uncharacterized delta-60 repeat protein